MIEDFKVVFELRVCSIHIGNLNIAIFIYETKIIEYSPSPESCYFQNVVCHFCAFIITGDMISFRMRHFHRFIS